MSAANKSAMTGIASSTIYFFYELLKDYCIVVSITF